jgi:hypothetical protein
VKELCIICFTVWVIATEYLYVDLLKFNARVEMIEEAARALHPQNVQPSLEVPGGAKLEKL